MLIAQCAGVLLALSTAPGAARQEPGPRRAHQEVPIDTLLDVSAVAQVLGLARSSIYELLRRNSLKGVHVGKYWKVRPEALAEFIAKHERS